MLSDRRNFETLVLLELYEKTQGKGETICAVAVVFCFEPWLCSVSPELLLWHLQTSLWMGVAAVHLESGDESSCVPGVSSCVLLSPAQEAVWISPHKAATAADAQGRGCFNRESFQAGESQSHVVMVTALCHSSRDHRHLHVSPLAKLSCSLYRMGLSEPLVPTSCTR